MAYNNRGLLLGLHTVLEAGRSKMAPARPPSGFLAAASHCVLIWREGMESLRVFLCKGTNPVHEGSPLTI